MKKILFTLLFLALTAGTYTQWVSTYSPTGDINFSNAKGNAVTTDAAGYSYVTGYSQEELLNGNDIITIKYDETGNIVWAQLYGGDALLDDAGNGICVDASGNVYVVGTVTKLLSGQDIIILKYNSSGTLQWVKSYFETGFLGIPLIRTDNGMAIATDAYGYVYIAGFSTPSDNKTDIFLGKYSASGQVVWTKTNDGSANLNCEATSLAVSSTGNIYVAGFITSSAGDKDMAVEKFNSNGSLQWTKLVSGTGGGEDKAWGIVVDGYDNSYITGYVTSAGGNVDAATVKVNTYGTVVWNSIYNGQGGSVDKAWGIVVDTDGSVFITGQTDNSGANTDYLTIRYNSNGTVNWLQTYNGTGNGQDIASSIAILNSSMNRSIVVTGKSWGTSDNYDYATVKYNLTDGTQTLASRYSFDGNTNDCAKALTISIDLKIVITGFSQLIFGGDNGVQSTYISTLSYNDYSSQLTSANNAPKIYSLSQNYPNPFNPSTTISFELPAAGNVKITVYDMLGKAVNVLLNQNLDAGSHEVTFSAANLSSGIYFYELSAGSFRDVKKMTLVK